MSAEPTAKPKTNGHPLVLDLDGTLITTDSLWEGCLAFLRTNPLGFLIGLLPALIRGRLAFKNWVETACPLEATMLPYNAALLDYARAQKATGRRVILATASEARIANKVADHLDIFDDVFASGEGTNLKGSAKAECLVAALGKEQFVYAGDSAADQPVWQVARARILVGRTDRLQRFGTGPVEATFSTQAPSLTDYIRQLRLYQWVKNVLVFAPMVAAGDVWALSNWWFAASAFFCFSLLASATYCVNDLLDLEADRQHARKCLRPLAASRIPISHIPWLVTGLMFASFAMAAFTSLMLVGMMLLYLVTTLLYSVVLKRVPLLDVFTLAGLYAIRLLAGGFTTGHLPSIWLLSFAGLLFLSLGFLKRHTELVTNQADVQNPQRGYRSEDISMLMTIGIGASFASCVVFMNWLQSDAFDRGYANQLTAWLMTPLLLYWQCRLWVKSMRGKMHDDPIVYAATDYQGWVIFALIAVLYFFSLR